MVPSNVELEAALHEEDSILGPAEYSPRPAEYVSLSLLTENVESDAG